MTKTIFITGASSGIGKEVALNFSKNKWLVLAAARRVELVKKIALEAKKKKDGIIIPIKLDITDNKNVKKVIKKYFNLYGVPDISLLNAGTNNPNEKKVINLDETLDIFNVNYFGTLNCINAILPSLELSKKKTQLVIMSSVAGYRGLPYAAAYCSSKAALINLAESMYNLCKEKSINIRLINPGFIKTPLTDKNKFTMPLIISSKKAGEIIYNKLNYSKSFEINLPWFFCFMMKIMRILPYCFYFRITSKLLKKL